MIGSLVWSEVEVVMRDTRGSDGQGVKKYEKTATRRLKIA
jgi:hypothetical protein